MIKKAILVLVWGDPLIHLMSQVLVLSIASRGGLDHGLFFRMGWQGCNFRLMRGRLLKQILRKACSQPAARKRSNDRARRYFKVV
jgi:hypothetical protein